MLIQLTNDLGGHIEYCAAHIDAKRRYLYGDITESAVDGECEECRQERRHAEAPAKMRAAMTSPDFSHTRFKYSQVHAYRRDDTSPSGVMLAASLDEPRFEALVATMRAEGLARHGGFSPLSPTEGL